LSGVDVEVSNAPAADICSWPAPDVFAVPLLKCGAPAQKEPGIDVDMIQANVAVPLSNRPIAREWFPDVT
jgi:hypothetical protein